MKLSKLIDDITFELIQGNSNLDINNIAYDSRKVAGGSLFVCLKGEKFDGHKFANEAIKKGAAALIVEEAIKIESRDVTVVKVKNAREALANISNIFYGEPSTKMNVVGITGTNGKTSISFLISEILQYAKHKVGVIGTIGIQVNNESLDLEKSTPTTPNSLELQLILNEMDKQKATDVVMEVTSIGLEQNRVDNCQIDIGVFTNLTEDHLDFHGTMENYKEAKRKLFEKCKYGIINIDDEAGREYVETMKYRKDLTEPILTYGILNKADLMAEKIILSPDGTIFNLKIGERIYPVKINLTGKFNVYNTMAAIGTTLKMGIPIEYIVKALEKIRGAKGRFEGVSSSVGYSVVVDYAHTPDALENVLQTALEFKPNKLITVFGCGGDRDKTKRPIMGQISGELSDVTILTSDNPRTEDPKQIIKDIQMGLDKSKGNYKVIEDREEAIKEAIKIAVKGDIIIVAGKGHEPYQILKDRTIHFDDMEIVKKMID